MIPNENKFFIAIIVLIATILTVGYLVFGDDEDVTIELPKNPVEQFKQKMHDGQN